MLYSSLKEGCQADARLMAHRDGKLISRDDVAACIVFLDLYKMRVKLADANTDPEKKEQREENDTRKCRRSLANDALRQRRKVRDGRLAGPPCSQE